MIVLAQNQIPTNLNGYFNSFCSIFKCYFKAGNHKINKSSIFSAYYHCWSIYLLQSVVKSQCFFIVIPLGMSLYYCAVTFIPHPHCLSVWLRERLLSTLSGNYITFQHDSITHIKHRTSGRWEIWEKGIGCRIWENKFTIKSAEPQKDYTYTA